MIAVRRAGWLGQWEARTGFWTVRYDVAGHGSQQTGPYTEFEAQDQARDIAGYEGVSNVLVEEQVADVRGER
jgi:alpha-beta hydrolase superfamily lysophospholipase